MTNALENTVAVNAYAVAIDKRINFEVANDSYTDNKKSKFEKYKRVVSTPKYAAFLTSIAADAEFVNETRIEGKLCNVYIVEKVYNYLLLAHDEDSVKDSCVAMIKTLINCANAKERITSDDFKFACSKSEKIPAARKHVIFQNSATQSVGTISSQHNSTYRALEALKVLKRVKTEGKRITFDIDTSNAVYQQLAALFDANAEQDAEE